MFFFTVAPSPAQLAPAAPSSPAPSLPRNQPGTPDRPATAHSPMTPAWQLSPSTPMPPSPNVHVHTAEESQAAAQQHPTLSRPARSVRLPSRASTAAESDNSREAELLRQLQQKDAQLAAANDQLRALSAGDKQREQEAEVRRQNSDLESAANEGLIAGGGSSNQRGYWGIIYNCPCSVM